jgi:hypothetical protein
VSLIYCDYIALSKEAYFRLLEERLGAAGSADEMFRVFSTFNPLFFRPAIKSAVNSFRYLVHQTNLGHHVLMHVLLSQVHAG